MLYSAHAVWLRDIAYLNPGPHCTSIPAGPDQPALLLTLYNSGVRVSEVTALTGKHVCFGASIFQKFSPARAQKERTVPLWPKTRQVLKAWFAELWAPADCIAFPNARGKPLARDGWTT